MRPRHSDLIDKTKLSACELKFGLLAGSRYASTPVSFSRALEVGYVPGLSTAFLMREVPVLLGPATTVALAKGSCRLLHQECRSVP